MTRTTMEVSDSTRDNLKQAGKKNQTYDQLINQRITCNAAGCDQLGEIEIKVPAGNFGEVTLFVCSNCVGKFRD